MIMNSTADSIRVRVAGRPHDECGVCGIVGSEEASKLAYLCLYALQHRGQETAGIVAARIERGKPHHSIHRGMGLVADVFTRETLDRLKGRVAIGHVRYSTTGEPIPSNTQPLATSLRHGPVALAHNGNLTNAHILRHALKGGGAIFQTTIDSEVILHLLSHVRQTEFEECLAAALRQIEGAYSLVLLHGKTLYAIRDPRGFRPLTLGRLRNGGWAVASETVAFDLIGAERVRDIEPGEVLRIEMGCEPVSLDLLEPAARARCIFELIYFSRPDSIVDGQSVHRVRDRLGMELWREQPAEADVVICVPDSSTVAAQGFARAAGLPFEHGLIRSHYIGRTFIEPHQRIRDFGAKIKYNPVRAVVDGKRVIVVDDSIVRGTTSRKIVRMLREAGAREIHFRVSCPPWRNPCYFGIDTPEREDLMAAEHSIEEMRTLIECDSLGFLSEDGLRRAAEESEGWCMACFTGKYPVYLPRGLTKNVIAEDESVSNATSSSEKSPRIVMEDPYAGKNL